MSLNKDSQTIPCKTSLNQGAGAGNHSGTEPTATEQASKMASWMKLRLALIFVGLTTYFTFIAFRLVQLQVLVNPELERLAEKQFLKTGQTTPHRLAIYDRNREELAVSIPAASIFARPRQIKNKTKTARVLARVLGGTPKHWLRRLKGSKPFVWIERQVTEEISRRIANEGLPGVFTESENHRIYPNGPLAAEVIGFTDIDGTGIAGMELSLNEELLQRGDRYAIPRDGKGNPSYLENRYMKPDDGKTGVYSTIDRRIQQITEEELEAAMADTGAKSVMAIVMDPHTGEILAMGQRPSYDPNRVKDYPSSAFGNRIISNLYEPGSTMKVLLASAALEKGLLTSKSPIDCQGGQITFGKKKIHDAEVEKKLGVIPLEKVLQLSSNIGAIKVAETLGTEGVKEALAAFGLVSKTGINLPGEVSSGQKPDRFWLPIFLATVGFGQGVSMTPLQIVSAYAPLANGGYWVRPRILLRERAGGGESATRRRVLSAKTVSEMKQILVGVTEGKEATGKLAHIENIQVAGKTGTAQKYEIGAGYVSHKYLASFIGFLPADNPDLLIGVFIDEPQGKYYAAQTAAPLFKKIAQRSLQILDRVPKKIIVRARTSKNAGRLAVSPQIPNMEKANDGWIVPDLKGLGMREALQLIGKHVEKVKISGTGYLISQIPKAGTEVHTDSLITLMFAPES